MNAQVAEANRRVLVIDDNAAIIQDFKKILCAGEAANTALDEAEAALFGDHEERPAALQFEIDGACQGEDGFALVEQAQRENRPYAMAFIDMRMPPGWDGVETIAHIWEKDPRLQVVVCTAYSDYSWEEMSERLDLGDRLLILKKPFDNIEAYQLASALTKKWEMTQQAEMKMSSLEEAVRTRTQALQAEITERKLLERKLEQLSVTDALTGLANRRRFDDTLTAECARAQRTQKPLGLLMIDIDHFKRYNDHYGHTGGDACLRRVASELGRSTRDCMDLVARFGGEEFAIVLPESDYEATHRVAQRCCTTIAALQEPHAATEPGFVTISVGITSIVPSANASIEELIELADAALYAAKRSGRNRVAGPSDLSESLVDPRATRIDAAA
jgi:diguanylate cyclase (GGDEF)-like protein